MVHRSMDGILPTMALSMMLGETLGLILIIDMGGLPDSVSTMASRGDTIVSDGTTATAVPTMDIMIRSGILTTGMLTAHSVIMAATCSDTVLTGLFT